MRSTDRAAQGHTEGSGQSDSHGSDSDYKDYVRFGVMIITAMVAMYALTFINTYAWDHVRWSETRFYMTVLMGASMAVIMLAFMWKMYTSIKLNVAIVLISVAAFALGTFLVRSQTTVEDTSYMSAMIPHHSIAILTSENSDIEDTRVCELAVEIIEAQHREISEMKWLIADIKENGEATTVADAEERPVPAFEGRSLRTCPSG